MTKLTQTLLNKINFKKHGTGNCLTLYQVTLFSTECAVVIDPTESMLRLRMRRERSVRISLDTSYGRYLRVRRAYRDLRADINQRAQYFNKPVYLYFWSRDCDCVESDEMVKYNSLREAKQAITDFYDNAEGACHHEYATKEAYDTFEGSQRDRVMEAHEDGRNYSV